MLSAKSSQFSSDWGYVKTGTNRVVNNNVVTPGWLQHAATQPADEKKIARNDLTSLAALIAYVAHKTGVYEFKLERKLADRFDIPNVSCLPASRYDEAIRYLVDGAV